MLEVKNFSGHINTRVTTHCHVFVHNRTLSRVPNKGTLRGWGFCVSFLLPRHPPPPAQATRIVQGHKLAQDMLLCVPEEACSILHFHTMCRARLLPNFAVSLRPQFYAPFTSTSHKNIHTRQTFTLHLNSRTSCTRTVSKTQVWSGRLCRPSNDYSPSPPPQENNHIITQKYQWSFRWSDREDWDEHGM
jgi:hypothetical protein